MYIEGTNIARFQPSFHTPVNGVEYNIFQNCQQLRVVC